MGFVVSVWLCAVLWGAVEGDPGGEHAVQLARVAVPTLHPGPSRGGPAVRRTVRGPAQLTAFLETGRRVQNVTRGLTLCVATVCGPES